LAARPGTSSVQDRRPGVQSIGRTGATIPRTTQSRRWPARRSLRSAGVYHRSLQKSLAKPSALSALAGHSEVRCHSARYIKGVFRIHPYF